MGQLKSILDRLSLKQRVLIAATVVLVAGGLVAFTRWIRERDFRPLYTGMSAEDAGAVVQKLRESGVDYRLGESGNAVLVPSARVAELRLQMATSGLPKSGRAGFELFDKTNFGATDFTEHINYRRALEGELERSVMSLSEVEHARVHLTFAKESVFLDQQQPAKASVMVKLRPGASLASSNVVAICHLVASAVENLAPESVSVLDMNGNLLSRPRRAAAEDQPSEAGLDYRQQLERDLLAKIGATLEPVVGRDRFRAGVSVECDLTGGEQTEETYDPARSVMTSSQKTEDVSGANAASGVPGTASNLPRPTSRPGSTGLGATRRTENIAYESSRVVRHTRLPQGTVKRVSAAVLVDHLLRWEGSGPKAKRILEPMPPEKLKTVRDLVAAAIGFDQARGDQLILETLPFEATLASEPPPAPEPPAAPRAPSRLPPWLERFLDEKNIVVVSAAAGAALLMVAAGVFFLLRRGKRKRVEMAGRVAELPAGSDSAQSLGAAENATEKAKLGLANKLAEQQAQKAWLDAEALNALKLPQVTTNKSEVLTKYITDSVKKDPVGAAQIVRSWLYEGER